MLQTPNEFSQTFPARHYEAGETFISADDTPHCVYYVVSGQVRQFDIRPNGTDITLNVFGPGSFISLTWGFGDAKNTFYFQTLSKSTFRIIPIEDIVGFFRGNPTECLALISRLGRGLDGYTKRLAIHLSIPASRRVAAELLLDIQRFGNLNENGDKYSTISVNELASRCGLARETASRQLKLLFSSTLIERVNGHIVVHDTDKLESYIYG